MGRHQPPPGVGAVAMPGSKKDKQEGRKAYTNTWAAGDIHKACCANPGFCCVALFCPCCVAYSQRKTLMFGDLTNYTCCNGDMCISGKVGEKNCPEFCLCCEVTCCFASAVATSRFMIQDEMRVENTKCDNCIIGFMICLQQLACIFRIAACITQNEQIERCADILDCVADSVYCSVCACMQTQQHEQIKLRDPAARAPGEIQGAMQPPPPPQQQQQPPPQPGYGQPAYGQPAYGQPVQPGYGQPAPAYGQPAYGQPVQPQYQQPPPRRPRGEPSGAPPAPSSPSSSSSRSPRPSRARPTRARPSAPRSRSA
ncbi:uncharacterized protein MICPUCDRAFT_32645 [Micromonas pusilla CCMP1545]|uniref:Predicted protein n=2 Tax=Micromonas pusilla TaxID=38833 RepID=C1MN29_MICPC|nr:uncharacterized protein MICPUCDRAFT_32645 [Micromonas pusilla CCMP1545]EEH59154.1 predicted protein [Micromonas pusilla CCMP1545]|eukprot:XP_003057509.1 predicted protein [Micromonas pusilla CCMP1545]